MKAQQRHQLQTNALADRMGRLVEGLRQGPDSRSTIGWVIGGLAIAVFLAWWLVRGFGGWSAEWVSLDNLGSPSELQRIADDNPGTLPARAARFQEARIRLRNGLHGLYSVDRAQAVQNVSRARELYRQLAPECKKDAILRQEALMGSAQAEEALIGVPKADSTESRGSLDTALALYKELADSYPDSFLGKQAAAHLRDLDANDSKVAEFYTKLNELAGGKKN